MNEASIWHEVGERGFRELAAAFYRRIPGDGLLGPMYSEQDAAGAEGRPADTPSSGVTRG